MKMKVTWSVKKKVIGRHYPRARMKRMNTIAVKLHRTICDVPPCPKVKKNITTIPAIQTRVVTPLYSLLRYFYPILPFRLSTPTRVATRPSLIKDED